MEKISVFDDGCSCADKTKRWSKKPHRGGKRVQFSLARSRQRALGLIASTLRDYHKWALQQTLAANFTKTEHSRSSETLGWLVYRDWRSVENASLVAEKRCDFEAGGMFHCQRRPFAH